jgi:RNA-directed DNA polymerase
MKEPHIEVATHDDPESCVRTREGAGEALTGARTGTVLSRENRQSGAPTPLSEAEGNTTRGRYRESSGGPARSKTRSTRGNLLRENREIPESPAAGGAAGRVGKAKGRTPATHDPGKSGRSVVPTNSPNKAGRPAAEATEGRDLAEGNMGEQNAPRTQCRTRALSALDRIREAAKKDKEKKFTALLHHVDIDRLRAAFLALKRDAAPGVDGVTWEQYAERLEENFRAPATAPRGYRARPSRRVCIPKTDGRQRPLGIASLEDKVVQRAVVDVLNAIYEMDFLGFSYGFRPGRSQHNALDALAVGIQKKKVNFVLDADIRGFFDAIDHGWLSSSSSTVWEIGESCVSSRNR